MPKNYKCPDYPEKCATGMSCTFHDPETQCPFSVKGMRDDCCVSMGHCPPPMDRNTKGIGKWLKENRKIEEMAK